MLFHNPIIYQNIISGIIAPHGITDLFHARQNNYMKQLLSINIACASSSMLLSTIHDPYFILDSSFFISSLIHFRHDMPKVFPSSNYVSSFLLLMTSICYNHDIFFLYMLLTHVPHHYYMNKNVIKENAKFNLSLLFLTTISCLYGSHAFNIFDSTFMYNLSQGIVISHIIYEELYIHKNRTNANMTLIPF